MKALTLYGEGYCLKGRWDNDVKPLPFEPTGMTTARWIDEITTTDVEIADLVVCQQGITFDALMATNLPYGGDLFPHVVRYEGLLFLTDGHHRLGRALLQGRTVLPVRLLDLDAA